jgi:hypothetical protein
LSLPPGLAEVGDDRATWRADSIRRRLVWEPGILNGNVPEPQGMHWRTFDRLQATNDFRVRVVLADMAAKPDLLGKRLDMIDFPH